MELHAQWYAQVVGLSPWLRQTVKSLSSVRW